MVDVRPDPKPVTEGGIGRKKPDRANRRRGRVTAGRDEWLRLREQKLGSCRLAAAPLGVACDGSIELHHLIPRSLGGDDAADNLVPLCRRDHLEVTRGEAVYLRRLAESLTDAEYAYVVGRLGEGAMERLFRVRALVWVGVRRA